MLKLLTSLSHFNSSEPAQSTLSAKRPQAQFGLPADAANGFTVKLTLNVKTFDSEINVLEIPNVLTVCLRQHDPLDRDRQNYPSFKMPDGSVPVLEATVVLHSIEHPDWTNMTIGIPLAMLDRPEGEHEIVLNLTKVCWSMYVDGQLLDNDFPFGYPQWVQSNTWRSDSDYVKKASIHLPAIEPTQTQPATPKTAPNVQYWIPAGHNNWVGDVATFFFEGRYHMFYLYDRRHHHSKFGCGAHYFEHISTIDFKTWGEHEAATPFDEQWETVGTGTPFVFNERLCLSYGLHTTRMYPEAKTTQATQMQYLKSHGFTGSFDCDATAGVPIGATYSISEDGVSKFTKTGVTFHHCQNPMVYTDPRGKLRMMANFGSKGIWESESINGGWHCINPDFPPGGDCTFFFHWGKFDYVIGGFTGFWSKPADAPSTAYEDVVAKGLDFYDGSNVPAVTEVSGGRFLMAAWIPIRGWAGPLIIRELIQYPDGRIGSKWMKEIMPASEASRALAAKIAETTVFPVSDKSFLLEFDGDPTEAKKGRLGISFLPEAGEERSCELQICPDTLRAQFGPGSQSRFADTQKSLREGGNPAHVGDYAIENLIDVDKPFHVRVIVIGSDKIGGTLIDAEIAGQRTMIDHRPDLSVKKMVVRVEGVALRDVRVAAINRDAGSQSLQ